MAELSSNLIVRGENIQTLYNGYVNNSFVVNRRYQRKLVWITPEKQAFIDSLRRQLPVPLVLTAELVIGDSPAFEIIDGLQRLNTVFSFIENAFPLDGMYFDLETLAETKLRRDNGELIQREPKLPRTDCVRIANYVLPMSTYRAPNEQLVEEVFRRINSNGRYLSRQEIRQAGAISNFADLVREVSAYIRSDTSMRDLVMLTAMPSISISSAKEEPGIFIDDVFWIKNRILEKDQVRESRDEEIVADLLASMILDNIPRYHSETLDAYYGLGSSDGSEKRSERIEAAVQRDNPELIRRRFEFVHGVLEEILSKAKKNFAQLVFQSPRQRVPRYYEAIFLALYNLLIKENREIINMPQIIKHLDGCGDRVLNITGGGGTWSAENKRINIAAVSDLLRDATALAKSGRDLLLEPNEARVQRLLKAAVAEQSLFEMKQGLHNLDQEAKLNGRLLDRVLQTVSAIANEGPKVTGYIVIGISDDQLDAERVKAVHGTKAVRHDDFYVTGIDHEIPWHGGSLDGYLTFLTEYIKNSDLDPELAANVMRQMRPVRFHGKTLILLPVSTLDRPVTYRDSWYERLGSNTHEVSPRNVGRLFARFSSR
ncbi:MULTISPECIES: GmrSD restriction endonuclease domain-containing protein [unclassified Micromonospora]|uniref:GmrSD restriction endonuclease domain-containing protein n=1 Tax=unclassified Micromonospora TaxID=2617518 RepID=UPI003A86EEF5